MEEDIKNIEEMLETKEDLIKYHSWVGTKFINSVEILLNRYKELEEYYEEQNEVNAKFIPTSVIEKKIEEYLEFDKKYKTYTKDGRENYSIEYFKAKTLQEILKEGRI